MGQSEVEEVEIRGPISTPKLPPTPPPKLPENYNGGNLDDIPPPDQTFCERPLTPTGANGHRPRLESDAGRPCGPRKTAGRQQTGGTGSATASSKGSRAGMCRHKLPRNLCSLCRLRNPSPPPSVKGSSVKGSSAKGSGGESNSERMSDKPSPPLPHSPEEKKKGDDTGSEARRRSYSSAVANGMIIDTPIDTPLSPDCEPFKAPIVVVRDVAEKRVTEYTPPKDMSVITLKMLLVREKGAGELKVMDKMRQGVKYQPTAMLSTLKGNGVSFVWVVGKEREEGGKCCTIQ
eukprot:Hpha_TRINITY_DN14034_c0_g1::TRINITY_DN14034_c0_g1_i1::g.44379::m.44379